ncbi:MAG TPA: acyl-CoA dehydrogenase family protein [Mycobacteriales bacterium]
MSIDFQIPDDVRDLRDRVARHVRVTVVPLEAKAFADGHGPSEDLRRELQRAARDAGVFAPTVPREWGGLGLDLRGQAVVLEEAGYSLVGPLSLNAAAPDEGNMHLLERVATEEQKARYLAPLAAGEVRSCFAMTEPPPGAGSDPSALRTTARPTGSGWVIDGRKRFITGAVGASFAICMASTPRDDGSAAATMFLVDADNPGMRVERQIGSIDGAFVGGHCEVVFEQCEVPDSAVLGAPGEGFRYAQVRLAPARLTHCMRWLGAARRAHEVALGYGAERRLFGSALGDLGMAQAMIADNEIDLAASRALIWQAAWVLDRGQSGKHETSIAKTFVSEAVGRVVDRAVQLCGSLGVSDESPLAQILRDVRPFRIYDGPSEVHRWSIARRALRNRAGNGAA